MRVTKQEVEHIARLAKLAVTEEEKETYCLQLNQILDYVDQLNTLDTTNVEPTYFVQYTVEALRPDQIIESLPREEVLALAPAHRLGFIAVPKIIQNPS